MTARLPRTARDLAHPFLTEERKLLFVNGEWCAPAQAAWAATLDPSNGLAITDVAQADGVDVARAARAAHNALFGPWGLMEPADRARLLLDLALSVEAHREELALIVATDQGKPLAQALWEAEAAANVLRFHSGAPLRMEGTTLASAGRQQAIARRERIGVCGLIVSWHQPLLSPARELGPALAAGNAVLLKPASQAPLAALRLVELAEEVGFPRGAINLLTGGAQAGEAIVAHPLVAKVFFAGSARAGRAIGTQAAAAMKPFALETGGRSPHVVLGDADLSAAAEAVRHAAFAQWWHPYSAGSRVFVERSVHDRFLEVLVGGTARLAVGEGVEPGVDVGPLVSSAHRDRAAGLLEIAKAERITVAAGGCFIDRPGYFMQPTILGGVQAGSVIAREAVVGPVLGITCFDTAHDAARLAAGLGECVGTALWTNDLARAQAMLASLQARTVWVNGGPHRGGTFRTADMSGGIRATGTELNGYTDVRTVIMNTGLARQASQ